MVDSQIAYTWTKIIQKGNFSRQFDRVGKRQNNFFLELSVLHNVFLKKNLESLLEKIQQKFSIYSFVKKKRR